MDGVDPLVMETQSAFAYVNNDPVNGVDPTGLECGPGASATLISAGVQPSSSTYETTYTYDSAGNLAQTTSPQTGTQTHITKSTDDQLGDVLSETDGDGNVTTNTYNADHELVAVQLPGGNCQASPPNGCTSYQYNADGERTSMTDADGNTTTYTYDAVGHLLSSENALDETWRYTYDPAGNELSAEDPAGNTTRYSYNADGEVLVTTQPDQSTLTNTYDEAGEKTAYADAAGNTTTYAYNDLGELTSTTNPIGVTQPVTGTYAYDANGNISQYMTSSSVSKQYAYNGDNQLASIAWTNGPGYGAVGYTYTQDGKLASENTSTGTILSYTYDANDDLSTYANASSQTVSYSNYDGNGNPLTITYPDGHQVTQTYNNRNELSSVTDWASRKTAFCYDEVGNLVATDFNVTSSACSAPSDVLTETNTYNAGEQLTGISDVSSGTTLESFAYGRGPDGLATSDTETGTPNAGQTSYGYNPLLELTSAGSATYSYDRANDLTTGPKATTQAFNAASQLCWSGTGTGTCAAPPSGTTTYTYDALGERTSTTPPSGSATTYGWSSMGTLAQVQVGTSSESYTYSNQGLLQSESGSSGSANYVWSPRGSVPVMLADGTNDYLHGPGTTPIEQVNASSGATSYVLTDDLGSVRGLVSTAGALQTAITYDAWENVAATSGSGATTPFSFAGGYKDAASGLLYFRARWYDAVTGQWMSVDPMVMETEEPYAYASNDPVSHTDAGGTIPCPTDATHYTGANQKYNCVAIVENFTGRYIWIRRGAKNSSFGIAHAEQHGINLAATEVALRHAITWPQRANYTDALIMSEYLPIGGTGVDSNLALYYAIFYVQPLDRVAPNSKQVTPDHQQIGLLTSFCRGYGGAKLPGGGDCPSGTSPTIISNQNPGNL